MFRLVFIVIIIAAISTGAYLAYTQPSRLPKQLQSFAPMIKSGIDSGLGTVQTAMSSAKNGNSDVLGVKTETSRIFQEDMKGKPIHQKAMEFTQYQYCKLIVSSYEAEMSSSTSATTSTPSPEKNE